MNNYPIKSNELSPYFRMANWDARFVNVNELNPKVYMVIEGKLRAVAPIATAFASKKGCSKGSLYLLAKVAGYEKKQIIHLVCDSTTFYHSVEDFNLTNSGASDKSFTLRGTPLRAILKEHGFEAHESSGELYPVLFYWDKHDQKVCNTHGQGVGLPVALWSDKNGIHSAYADNQEECVKEQKRAAYASHKFYKSRALCASDNEPEVVDFDDDEQEPADQQWLVDLPKTVTVTAKTEEEAKQKVRDGLDRILK